MPSWPTSGSTAHIAALAGAGPIQLQLALDFPDAVHSLAVLVPVLPVITERCNESSSEYAEVLATTIPLIEQGRIADAFDTLFRYLGGPTCREESDRHPATGMVRPHRRRLGHGVPARLGGDGSWKFDADDAARITAPVLNMTAANCTNLHQAYHDAIKSWIPHAENVVLPDTGLFTPETNPRGTAEVLADFFGRHPMEDRGA